MHNQRLLALLSGGFAIFLSVGVYAWSDDCAFRQENAGSLIATRFATTGLGCVVDVGPADKTSLVYRDYVFDERGRLRVFSSLPGQDNVATGSRNFFFFPRLQTPNFAVSTLANGAIEIYMSNSRKVVVSTATSRLIAMENARFTELPEVSMANAGGLEIKSMGSIYLDTGWGLGQPGYFDRQRYSTFFDTTGRRCEVRNDEAFFYSDTFYGEPNFLFTTDRALARFLSAKCPKFDVKPLLANEYSYR